MALNRQINTVKITPKSHKKRNIILAVIGLIVIFAAAAAALEFLGVTSFLHSNKPSSANKEQETRTNLNAKEDFIEKSTSKNSNTDKTSDQVPVNKDLIATITRLEQTDEGVIFSATVTNSPTAGRCVVTFTNPNDKPVVKEVDATTKDGTALCGPLTVSPLEFSYLGEWQVTLRYYFNDQQAVASEKVTIR